MNLEQMKNKISNKFPNAKLEYDEKKDLFSLQNLVLVKRFDMGFSWNVEFRLEKNRVIQKTFTCSTHTNSSIDYEQQLDPTIEVLQRYHDILSLLKIADN